MDNARFRPLYPSAKVKQEEAPASQEKDVNEVTKLAFLDGGVRPHVEELEERYLTPKEAAEFLRVARNTIYRMVSEGTLPAARLGSAIRIKKSDLVIMMEKRTK